MSLNSRMDKENEVLLRCFLKMTLRNLGRWMELEKKFFLSEVSQADR